MKDAKKSDIFIWLLSSNSVDRKGYFQKEMKIAMSVLDELPDDHIYFLPIRIDSCSIPEDISNIHCIDLFSDSEFGLRKIINAIEFQKKRARIFKKIQKVLLSQIWKTILLNVKILLMHHKAMLKN